MSKLKNSKLYYRYIFKNALKNESENILNSIPEKYLPKNFFNFKDNIKDFLENKNNDHNISIYKFIEQTIINNRIDLIEYLFKISCEYDYIEIIKFLFENNYTNNLDINYGLMTASRINKSQVVKYLATHGADIHYSDEYCLKYACFHNNINLTKYLINHFSFNRNNTCFISFAAMQLKPNLFNYLIKENFEIDYESVIKNAVTKGNLNIIKFLIKNKIDIHYNDDFILKKAEKYGKTKIINYILKNYC